MILYHLHESSLQDDSIAKNRSDAKNYPEPNDWSDPISTGRPNEVMAILTRLITLGLAEGLSC